MFGRLVILCVVFLQGNPSDERTAMVVVSVFAVYLWKVGIIHAIFDLIGRCLKCAARRQPAQEGENNNPNITIVSVEYNDLEPLIYEYPD